MDDGLRFSGFHTAASNALNKRMAELIAIGGIGEWEEVEPLYRVFCEEVRRINDGKDHPMLWGYGTEGEQPELVIQRVFDLGDLEDVIELKPLPLSELLLDQEADREQVERLIALAEESIRRARAKLNAAPQA